jgi:hypothetical protein
LESQRVVHQLPIPPRLQWMDRGGFCGECSIQQAALYFGNYVSQAVCRKIIDPNLEDEVLVSVNTDVVLKFLRLEFEEFNTSETPTPQFKAYLQWTKQHLHAGHPVILTVYVNGNEERDYDHIVLATGFKAKEVKTYRPDDLLVFNDHMKRQPLRREFKTLPDSRDMQGNGAEYLYCIPKTCNFGCAVTGNEDETRSLIPVRLTVDRSDEPNLVNGKTPVKLKLTAHISGLQPDKQYVLYRYDNTKNIPVRDYAMSKYFSARKFTADKTECAIQDDCLSSDVAMYRCLAQ